MPAPEVDQEDGPTPLPVPSPTTFPDQCMPGTQRRTPQSVADELLEVVEQVSEAEHAALMPTGSGHFERSGADQVDKALPADEALTHATIPLVPCHTHTCPL